MTRWIPLQIEMFFDFAIEIMKTFPHDLVVEYGPNCLEFVSELRLDDINYNVSDFWRVCDAIYLSYFEEPKIILIELCEKNSDVVYKYGIKPSNYSEEGYYTIEYRVLDNHMVENEGDFIRWC